MQSSPDHLSYFQNHKETQVQATATAAETATPAPRWSYLCHLLLYTE